MQARRVLGAAGIEAGRQRLQARRGGTGGPSGMAQQRAPMPPSWAAHRHSTRHTAVIAAQDLICAGQQRLVLWVDAGSGEVWVEREGCCKQGCECQVFRASNLPTHCTAACCARRRHCQQACHHAPLHPAALPDILTPASLFSSSRPFSSMTLSCGAGYLEKAGSSSGSRKSIHTIQRQIHVRARGGKCARRGGAQRLSACHAAASGQGRQMHSMEDCWRCFKQTLAYPYSRQHSSSKRGTD